jgi:malonyl-CoA/methylmalonyl-CoA synthetase
MAQAESLIQAWEYRPEDHLLHVLPLHHIHGVIPALLVPIVAGSTVEFLTPYDPHRTLERITAPFHASSQPAPKKITIFTAVPSIYAMLLMVFPQLSQCLQDAIKEAFSVENMRLNISGSAPLPPSIQKPWVALTGSNGLLERYGMSEIGMALSCGLAQIDRVEGSVGWPLPFVEIRLVDLETGVVLPQSMNEVRGEIQIRGATVFKEYWEDPAATQKEFVRADDGGSDWFRTGDIAVRKMVEGAGTGYQPWTRGPMYFIQGRLNVDILKSGGEKISALEVERALLTL